MRILFLCAPTPDYLQDGVYHGLVSQLGAANVVDWPRNPRYHGQVSAHESHRFTAFDHADPEREATLAAEMGRCDAVIVASLRDGAYAAAQELVRLEPRCPVVFLDGEDDVYVRDMRRHCDLYFKRELRLARPRFVTPFPLQQLYFSRKAPFFQGPLRRPIAVATVGSRHDLRPLPFGILETQPPLRKEADYDVAFMARPTSPERARVRSDLQALEREGLRVFQPAQPIARKEYLDVLSRSRIGISVRGAGFDTYRYWEIPWTGAFLLSEEPDILIPHNFEHGAEALFAPAEQLAAAVPRLLSQDLEAKARRAQERLLSQHTCVHRARTVLDAIEEKLSGSARAAGAPGVGGETVDVRETLRR